MCVCVGFVMCGCFGNICTCNDCVLYCLYCVFCVVSFMYIYSCLFCLYWCKDYCHRVTVNNNNNNNNEYIDILGASVGNLVATANWRPVFAQACFKLIRKRLKASPCMFVRSCVRNRKKEFC